MSKFKDKALSLQYDLKRLRSDRRSGRRNRRVHPEPLKATKLDEFVEFRKKEARK